MSLPDYQECMLPLLECLVDGTDHHMRDLVIQVADRLAVTPDERSEMLPSGQQTVIANRVAWAKTYLKKAGLVSNPLRGITRITDRGLAVIKEKPARVDTNYLKRFDSFVEFKGEKSESGEKFEEQAASSKTPEEQLEESYGIMRSALAEELLDRAKAVPPQFFEKLVVELLVAMGYGGSLADAGQSVGRSGDGGIDGIIKEDKLGLDVVCIQAKRWDKNSVGRPEVQAFAGSMEGFRARKGVLITTSSFTKDARQYVTHIERKIVLIDGKELANLMVEHNIGVETTRTIQLKRIDQDYFDDNIE